ncbi:hypothetical protein DFQ28_010162 [Apophysomyces sp. BC1034]|nr:hypothetical protein DFQ30_009702 [Apophysomyces sp. BC1015]KAG0171876.1 hypothetical protein DFQ29_008647 [Apophysomyces sp. BC1021]KAG0184965.1 hypothetical protein DFQ28_010162 [Apophysomyces sp. BC1034]
MDPLGPHDTGKRYQHPLPPLPTTRSTSLTNSEDAEFNTKTRESKQPPTLSSSRNSTLGSSTDTKVAALPKTSRHALLKSQVDLYAKENEQLADQVKQLRREKREASAALQKRCLELEELLKAKEDEYTKMQTAFHQHLKALMVTDDDFSTIRNKLVMIQSKIAAFPMSLRRCAQDRASATQFFIEHWPHLAPAISRLTKPAADNTPQLEYSIICLLVEKLITQTLVTQIYGAHVHVGFPIINEAYNELFEWMNEHDCSYSTRLRQQLCKVVVTAMDNGDKKTVEEIAAAKDDIVTKLADLLDNVFEPDHRADVVSKLTKVVDAACECGLAIHGQEHLIVARDRTEGEDILDVQEMELQHGSQENGSILQIVICPPFYANDDAGNDLVLIKGKAICF